jgi:hypothetical protein
VSGAVSASADSIRPRTVKQIQGRYTTLCKRADSKSGPISVTQDDSSSSAAVNSAAPSEIQQINISHTDTSTTSPLPVIDSDSGYEVIINATPSLTPYTESSQPANEAPSQKRKYEPWSASATDEFSRLYDQHYKKHCAAWTFREFTAVWDIAAHGNIEQPRWKARNQTEARRKRMK